MESLEEMRFRHARRIASYVFARDNIQLDEEAIVRFLLNGGNLVNLLNSSKLSISDQQEIIRPRPSALSVTLSAGEDPKYFIESLIKSLLDTEEAVSFKDEAISWDKSRLNTQFDGRIVQVTEALSYQDAVSDHVINLNRLVNDLGLRGEVYTKYHDTRLDSYRLPLEELHLSDRDVVILHFYGKSDFALEKVSQAYCTKIILYHNITPAHFFPTGSRLCRFCTEGREQLASHLRYFHFTWAVSQFNLDELLSLGAKPITSAIVPIIVHSPVNNLISLERKSGSWLFIGRIAPNKNQVGLVRLFAEVRRQMSAVAQTLILAGGFEPDDLYFNEIKQAIHDYGLNDAVQLLGKVTDEEREILYKTASVYVSISEHEGFGVPLVEAALRGLPVVALRSSAISETLKNFGVFDTETELLKNIIRLHQDEKYRINITKQQADDAKRFGSHQVRHILAKALGNVLPVNQPFNTVSVIICTYNRRAYLERVLDYLQYQRNHNFEVIVVDGPSYDGTKELLSKNIGKIKITHNPERNLSKSRNLGIELADGDIVAFIDDDALPFDDWGVRVLNAYNTRPLTTAGLGGPAYYAGTFWFQAQDNGINKFADAKINIDSAEIGSNGWFRYNTGTNATFVTSKLRTCGGFDEQFDYYLDESELCYRLQLDGALIAYEPEVVVRHEFAQSHNRQGRLNYNWYTICKNTAYFIAAYSGVVGEALNTYLNQRMQLDRIQVFEHAQRNGEISEDELNSYRTAVIKGITQGVLDAQDYPRIRELRPAPGNFLPYSVIAQETTSPHLLERLHICIISREFPPFAAGGGVGTLYYHLASELIMMGHKVTVIVPAENPNIFEQGNIRVHFTPTVPVAITDAEEGFVRNMSWSISALQKLAAIHKEDPIHIIDSALWDTEALAVTLLPKESRPHVIVRLVTPYALAASINGWNPPARTQNLFMEVERALITHADAVVPISESIASSIEKTYDIVRDNRWHHIPCGIAYWPFFDVNQGYNEFPQLEKLPREALECGRMILFLGRLERRKGIDLIFDAAPSFLMSAPDAHLVLAGRDVEGWAGRELPAELRNRIHYVGEVDNPTRDKLLARAWCVLFPSRYESFGLVPLEAFVHGVPVIAASAGAIPEVVEDKVSGLLFESGSAVALASAVASLLANEDLYRRLTKGAGSRVRALGSRISAERSVALYHKVLGISVSDSHATLRG